MAEERIEAWLAVRDSERFDRDMDRSARSIRKLRRETDDLNKRGVALGQGFLGVRVGLAEYTALAAGALPVIVGLAGATGALASTLGAAAAGSIALGVGIAGTVLPAMVGMGIVLGRQASSFKDVHTALDAYQLAVRSFGRDSTQAETALRRLSGQVEQNGGGAMLRAVRLWEELGETFDRLTAPSRASLGRIITQGLESTNRLLPSFTNLSNRAFASIEANAGRAFSVLSGPEVAAGLGEFGNTLEVISGPLMNAFVNGLMFLFRVARASQPYVIGLARGIEDFGEGLDRASSDPVKLANNIGVLVSHTRAWWGLLVEVGLLLVAVMRGGANEGKSFVETLTAGVHQLRMMAESVEGQRSIASFMRDSVNETIAFAKALWSIFGPLMSLARDAMPLWIDILEANAAGLRGVATIVLWLSDLLSPFGGLLGIVIVGFWGWRAAVVAWNIVAGIATFVTGGWVTAFWALNAAMYANPIGLVVLAVIAVGAALIYAYHKVGWFREAVQAVLGWIKDNWPLLLAVLTAPFRVAALFITGNFDAIRGAAEAALNFVVDKLTWAWGQLEKFDKKLGGLPSFLLERSPPGLILKGASAIGGLATGGNIIAGGLAVVGERGPELARFAPGSAVAPLRPATVSGRGTVRAIDRNAVAAAATHRTIVVPVEINGREIARVTAEDTDDRMARGPGEID